ncbi:MAG: HepT-like ribonuclease domain-containing protein [Planctomycetota bacterium]|jgi:uncharacterized protein with HEPN domain
MMRDSGDYISDLLEAISDIEEFTGGMDFECFSKDKKTINAVIRSLEVLGEASRNISDEIKEKYPDVPWRQMRAMRNKLSHEYFGIDIEIVWAVIDEELPALLPQVEAIKEDFQL